MSGLKTKVWIQIVFFTLAQIGVKSDDGEFNYLPQSRLLTRYALCFGGGGGEFYYLPQSRLLTCYALCFGGGGGG